MMCSISTIYSKYSHIFLTNILYKLGHILSVCLDFQFSTFAAVPLGPLGFFQEYGMRDGKTTTIEIGCYLY